MQPQGDNKSITTELADSDDVVFDLLEALLQEVDEKPDAKVVTTVETLVQTEVDLQVEPQTKQNTEQKPGLQTEQQVEIQSENVKIFEQLPLEMQERLITQATEELKIKNSLPEWVESSIPSLLVEVEKTELAVPLILLNGISVWDQQTLPIPTQPDWHLGVIEYRGDKIIIVDTARLIMPEVIKQTAQERRDNHASHFLRVGQNLALSCDAIKETISLKQDEVRWRIKRTSRPWAVGILIDRLCVLLDAKVLMQEIQEK